MTVSANFRADFPIISSPGTFLRVLPDLTEPEGTLDDAGVFGSGVEKMAEPTAGIRKSKSGNAIVPRERTVDVQPLDGLLGFHLRLAMMELRRSFLRNVDKGAVRPGLASLLQLVAANPGASQVDLARAMHVDKASLVALLDKAEAAGWLKRVRSKDDRRRHELMLTASGQTKAAALRQQMMRHEKKYIERYTPAELEQLVKFLRRIYD